MHKHPDSDSLEELRTAAATHTEQGAVTPGYSADRKEVIRQLNQALATELVCVLRYRRHWFMARGIHARSVAAEFLEHSNQELGHADSLAARIVQLGGEPDFAPDSLSGRSHAEYGDADNLKDMLRQDLVAERIAIDSYRATLLFIADQDPTTSDMLKKILAVEEEHADDLADILSGMDSDHLR